MIGTYIYIPFNPGNLFVTLVSIGLQQPKFVQDTGIRKLHRPAWRKGSRQEWIRKGDDFSLLKSGI